MYGDLSNLGPVLQLRGFVDLDRPRWEVLVTRDQATYRVSVLADTKEEAARLAEDVVDADGTEQWPRWGV